MMPTSFANDHDSAIVRTAHRVGYAFSVPTDAGVPPPDPHGLTHWLVVGTRRFPLHDGVNIIGRDPDVTVCLDSVGVSRRHAQIVLDQGSATLEDLGSKNGTLVGNEPVRVGGEVVGRVTSGNYGWAVERSIAYAYLPPELATIGTRGEVEVFGDWIDGVVAARQYDVGQTVAASFQPLTHPSSHANHTWRSVSAICARRAGSTSAIALSSTWSMIDMISAWQSRTAGSGDDEAVMSAAVRLGSRSAPRIARSITCTTRSAGPDPSGGRSTSRSDCARHSSTWHAAKRWSFDEK